MRITLSLIILCALAALSVDALACSCVQPEGKTEQEQVQAELRDAKQVFVGKPVKLQRAYSDRFVTEDVEFKVIEVLKGDYTVGQIVKTRTRVGGGMCGRTVRESAPDETTSKVEELADWLIYAYGPEPHELSFCSRSKPVDATTDLAILRSLK